MLDNRVRNEAAITDAELELLRQANQLQEDLVMAEAGQELLARAGGTRPQVPAAGVANLDRAIELLVGFLAAHGTAIVLDPATGHLAEPKWSRTRREFVASADRAA